MPVALTSTTFPVSGSTNSEFAVARITFSDLDAFVATANAILVGTPNGIPAGFELVSLIGPTCAVATNRLGAATYASFDPAGDRLDFLAAAGTALAPGATAVVLDFLVRKTS